MATPVRVDVLFDAGGFLKKGILALGSAFAASKVVQLATEQEQAIERMNTQLKLTGDFSEEASQDMQTFASSLQSASTFGDEVILGQIALAKSFGATNEQAKLIAKTAADLSVSMGISLDSATEQVSKTLGGFAGRLGQAIPALKGLSKEALLAGEGVQLLSKRFAGAAAAQIKTFGGALTQLKNTFGDVMEEIGFIVTDNPVVVSLINTLEKALSGIGAFIKSNRESIIATTNEIIQGVAKFARAIIYLNASVIKSWINFENYVVGIIRNFLTWVEKAVNYFVRKFPIIGTVVQKVVNFIRDQFNILRYVFLGILERIVDFASNSFIGKALRKAGVDVDGITASMHKLKDEAGEAVDNFKEIEVNAGKALTLGARKYLEFRDKAKPVWVEIANLIGKAGDKVGDLAENLKKAGTQGKKTFEQLAASAGGGMQAGDVTAPSFEQQAAGAGGRMQAGDVTVPAKVEIPWSDIGKNFTSTISQGAEGARTFLTNSVSTIATKFLGPVGGVFGDIFNLFSQTPEKFEEMIRGFVEAIPQMISNIFVNLSNIGMILTDAVLNAVEELLENFPKMLEKFIRKFIDDVPRIINRIISQVPRFINALIKAVPSIVGSFISEFVKSVPKIIEEFIKSITGFGGGGGGGGLLGGIPIVGDVLGGIGSVFGFAKGGMVPDGFPNDTFPARLTSRELVIDRSLTDKLDSYLDGQQGNNDQTGLLNAILVELRKPMTVSSNLELDNRNFGQVILELNRDNERLEA